MTEKKYDYVAENQGEKKEKEQSHNGGKKQPFRYTM